MAQTFLQAKNEFDAKYRKTLILERSLVPVDGKYLTEISLKNKKGELSEEYYKWQFIFTLTHSGLYSKDYLGAEIYFPKGNKSSAPIKIDACIFDDKKWIDFYEKWRKSKDDDAVEWLRQHLIGTIEFKKSDGKDIKTVFTSQVKAELKESESNYRLGFYYDSERLYIFQRKNGAVLRYDESKNQKGDKSSTTQLSLDLTDSYTYVPSFDALQKRINTTLEIDRSKRTVDDLDPITGAASSQINQAISNILKTLDRVGLGNNPRGYEILIEMLALKIFDEKRSEEYKKTTSDKRHLKFYQTQPEKAVLSFFITDAEKQFFRLSDENVRSFVERIRELYNNAAEKYNIILKQADKAQFITPLRIIDFLVKIVNPGMGETIIDPTVGIADFLSMSFVNAKGKLDDHNIFGIDNDDQMIKLAQLNMLLNGDGNATLKYQADKGSLLYKFNTKKELVSLDAKLHKNGNWDNWVDETKLMKFDVVLTNPPFGENRKIEPKNESEKAMVELYELWDIARSGNWMDPGLLFLENAYRILKTHGRLGIVLSNSIASIDRWEIARKWLE